MNRLHNVYVIVIERNYIFNYLSMKTTFGIIRDYKRQCRNNRKRHRKRTLKKAGFYIPNIFLLLILIYAFIACSTVAIIVGSIIVIYRIFKRILI